MLMKVILIAAYVISCFLNDRFSFFPLLGSFAAYGLSPMTAGKLVAQKMAKPFCQKKQLTKRAFGLLSYSLSPSSFVHTIFGFVVQMYLNLEELKSAVLN